VCVDCLRELNDPEVSNSQSIRNRTALKRSREIEIETEELQIQSESIASVLNAPLSTSLGKNTDIGGSLDLEKLKEPGEIEKLIPNNRNVQRDVRQLLAKSMPVAVKKRKLNEMLQNIPIVGNINAGQRSNLLPQNVVEQRRKSDQECANEILSQFLNQSGRIVRTYRDNSSSIHSSQSVENDSGRKVIAAKNVSSQEPILLSNEVAPLPLSPIISARTQTPVPLYHHDTSSESSDSDRIRNTSLPSNDASRRRSSGRVPSINQSDDGRAARRSSGRVPSINQSSSSDDGRAARKSADRRQNDGNNHSNLAAPRRINITMPNANGHQVSSKSTNGG